MMRPRKFICRLLGEVDALEQRPRQPSEDQNAKKPLAIPESQWKWEGRAGHFICADRCCFRLTTTVGMHRVSTVGCYHPRSDESEEPHSIGCDRLYETMVFALDADGDVSEWTELDFAGYNVEGKAAAGHLAMCRKWADPDTAAREDA